jgi:DNA-binding transcriptional ArsR family regulator
MKLLFHLTVRPRTPTELAALENKHLSQVSRSLGELKRRGLVELAEARSRERYYKPTRDGYIVYAYLTSRTG